MNKVITPEINDDLLYYPQEFQEIMKEIANETVENQINQIFIASETNNHNKMDILSNYIHNNLLKTKKLAKHDYEKLILILDKYISANVLDLNPIARTLSLFIKLVKKKHIRVVLDWKNYYKLFNLFFGKSKFELNITLASSLFKSIESLDYLFIRVSRYYEMSQDDYKMIKEDILQYCYAYDHDTSFQYGLSLIINFVPFKYFEQDIDLQGKLLNIFINLHNLSDNIVSIFAKFIKLKLSLDLNTLIGSIFNRACLFVTEDYKSSVLKKKEKLNKVYGLMNNLTKIIINFLFNDHYSSLYEISLERFKMLIKLIDGNLRENTKSSCIGNNLSFLSSFLSEMYKYQKKLNKKNKNNKSKEINNDKFVDISSLFEKSVIKAMFLTSDQSAKLVDKYSLINNKTVNFKLLEVFEHFVYDDIHHIKTAIDKLPYYLQPILNNFDNSRCHELLNKLIDLTVINFNSINVQNNYDIIILYNQLYTFLPKFIENEHYIKNKKFNEFLLKIEKNSLEIVKKYFSMYELFSLKSNNMNIDFFFYNLMIFSSEQSIDIIEINLVDYLKENLIISKCNLRGIENIILLLNERRSTTTINRKIFNHCFDYIIETEVEKSQETVIECILSKINTNKYYKLNRSNDSRITSLLKLLLMINLNSLTDDQTIKHKFFSLLCCLLTAKEDSFIQKFLKFSQYYVLTNLKEKLHIESFRHANYLPNKNYKKCVDIKFPQESSIDKVIEYYNLFCKPYIDVFLDRLSDYNAIYNQFKLEFLDLNKQATQKEISLKFNEDNKFYIESTKKFIRTFLLVSSPLNSIGVLFAQYLTKIDLSKEFNFIEKAKYEEINKYIDTIKGLNIILNDFVYQNKFTNEKEYLLKNFLFQEIIAAPQRHNFSPFEIKQTILFFKNNDRIEKSYLQFIKVNSYIKSNNLFFYSLTKRDLHEEKKLINLSKLIIKTQNQLLVFKAGIDLNYIFNKLNQPEDKKLIRRFFKYVFDDYLKRIAKIKSNEKPNQYLINEQSKLTNLLDFLIKLLNVYILFDKEKFSLSIKLEEFLLFVAELNLANIKNHLLQISIILSSIIFTSSKQITFVKYISNNKFFRLNHKTYLQSNNLIEFFNNLNNKYKERIIIKSEKITKLRENQHDLIISILEKNYERLNIRKSSNFIIEYNLKSLEIMTLCRYINFNDDKEFKLFKSYEEKLFSEILSNKTFVEKKILLYCLNLFLKIKQKLSIEYNEIDVQENLNKDKDFLLRIKNNNVSNDTTSYVEKEITFCESMFNPLIRNTFSDFNSLFDFVKILFHLKDLLDDENKTTGNNNLDHSVLFKSLASPKMFSKFLEIMYSYDIISSTLFEIKRVKLYYYIFSTNQICDYNIILKVLEKIAKENTEKKEEIYICVLAELLGGMARYLIKIKNYNPIPTIMKAVLKYYTDNINKKIDLIVVTFTYFIFQNISVNDFIEIMKVENFFVNLTDSLILRITNQLINRFNQKMKVLFDNKYFSPEKILENVISNDVNMIKNCDHLINFFRKYIYLFELKIDKDYIYSTEGFTRNALQKIKETGENYTIKEYNHAYVNLLKMMLHIFIKDPYAIVVEMFKLSKMYIIDDEKLNLILQTFPNSFLGIANFPLNINSFLMNFPVFYSKLTHIKSRIFFINCVHNLTISRVNNKDDLNQIILSFFSLLAENQYETNEHFSTKILPFYLQYLSLIDRKELIDYLIYNCKNLIKPDLNHQHNLSIKSEKFSNLVCFSSSMSYIFSLGAFLQLFELNVNDDIQKIILYFKETNQKIYKNKGTESKLLKNFVTEFLKKRDYTYTYIQKFLTDECHLAIQDLSKSHAYFL